MPELYEKCALCAGTKRIPPDAKVCDYPAALTPPACLCTLGPTPGWMASGLNTGQFDLYRRKAEAGERFKTFVHDYLTLHHVPEGDPGNRHQKEGCRIGARLDLLLAERDKLALLLRRVHHHLTHVADRLTPELMEELRVLAGE